MHYSQIKVMDFMTIWKLYQGFRGVDDMTRFYEVVQIIIRRNEGNRELQVLQEVHERWCYLRAMPDD